MRSKLLASVVATVLAPVAALSTVALAPAVAKAEVKKARCDVHAVLALEEGDGTIPDELKFLEERLRGRQFAPYKKFILVGKKTAKAMLEAPAEFKFETGHRLTLGLLGSGETHLKLRATLFGRDGDKKLAGTDYSIADGDAFFLSVGAITHDGVTGDLFFALQCARL